MPESFTTRSRLTTITLGGGVASLVLLLSMAVPSWGKSECERASDWAEANIARLPTDLDSFSSLSPSYRRAAYRLLPSDVRERLWRQHLDSYAADEVGLSAEQTMVLNQIVRNLGTYLQAAPDSEAVSSAESLVLSVFERRQAAKIFASLGSNEDFMSAAADCHCNVGGTFTCDMGTNPDDTCTAVECRSDPVGCGFLFLFKCNGRCTDGRDF